ncbi:hypothetical protein [Embleya scabrispora]|uniref:hypothetical protein n=1 Tax=Embleya scabrispora TaxID=159449 RepID=UPI002AA513EC
MIRPRAPNAIRNGTNSAVLRSVPRRTSSQDRAPLSAPAGSAAVTEARPEATWAPLSAEAKR